MSLIAWYPLHKNLKDWTGNKGDLTNTNGVIVDGLFGDCYQFDGTGYLTFPEDFTLEKEGGSLAFWIKPSVTSNLDLFGKGSDAGSVNLIEIRGNHFYAETSNNCGYFSSPTNLTYNANEWLHVTVVFKENRCFWYTNGNLLGETANYGNTNCAAPNIDEMIQGFTFRYFGGGGYSPRFSGCVQDIRIYDHAISTKEVNELSKAKFLHWDYAGLGNNSWNTIRHLEGYTSSTHITDEVNPLGGVGGINRVTGKIRYGATDGSFTGTLNSGHTWCFSVWLRIEGTKSGDSFEFDVFDRQDAMYQIDYDGNIIKSISNVYTELTNDWKRFAVIGYHDNNTNYNFLDMGKYQGTMSWDYFGPQITCSKYPTKYYTSDTIVKDKSGFGNDGYQYRGDNYAKVTSIPNGVMGSECLHLLNTENNDSFVLIRALNVYLPYQFTVSTWLKGGRSTGDQVTDNIYPIGYYQDCFMGPGSGVSNRVGIIYYDDDTHTSLQNGIDAAYDNNWHMHTMTFDGTALTYYFDGVQMALRPSTSFYHAGSLRSFHAGSAWSTGYGGHTGEIDDTIVFAKSFSADEVLKLYKSKGGISKDSSIHITEAIENGFKPTLVDYSTWQVGGTSATGFGRNGGADENIIEVQQNPVGELDVVWTARNNTVSSDSDGGFETSTFPVDRNSTYRYTIWIKRDVTGNGSWYWGTRAYNASSVNNIETLSGSTTTNPYFEATSTLYAGNEWFLVVGYVYPFGTTSPIYTDDGCYLADGTRIDGNNSEFRWRSDTVSSKCRSYLYYSTDTSTVQYFYRPRVEKMDGTQPSLETLLKCGEHRPLLEKYEGNDYKGKKVDITKQSQIKINSISELGITNGMVRYWDLTKSLKDLTGRGNIATLHGDGYLTPMGAVSGTDVAGGVNFQDSGQFALVKGKEGHERFTISVLVKPENSTQDTEGMIFAKAGGHSGLVTMSNKFCIRLVSPSAYYSYDTETIVANQWYHVAWVCEDFKHTLYVNGIEKSNMTISGSYSWSTDRFDLSYTSNGSYQFEGIMANAKMFDRALSAKEIGIEAKHMLGIAQFGKDSTIYTKQLIEI